MVTAVLMPARTAAAVENSAAERVRQDVGDGEGGNDEGVLLVGPVSVAQ
jgi:hypothetical protein